MYQFLMLTIDQKRIKSTTPSICHRAAKPLECLSAQERPYKGDHSRLSILWAKKLFSPNQIERWLLGPPCVDRCPIERLKY